VQARVLREEGADQPYEGGGASVKWGSTQWRKKLIDAVATDGDGLLQARCCSFRAPRASMTSTATSHR
jgi:hypothetical protein